MRGDGLHEGLVVDTAAADVKLGGVRGEPCDGVRDRAGGQFDERSCDVFGLQALMAAKAGVEPGGREELPARRLRNGKCKVGLAQKVVEKRRADAA